MRQHKLYFVLFLVIFFLRCRKKVEEKNNFYLHKIEETDNKENHKKIIITGTADDTLALKYINLINNAYLFGKNYKNTKRNFFKDSIYIEVDSIFKPQSFEFVSFGDSTFYRSQIYLTPGDSVSFKIKDKKIHFYGDNAAYNNFFISLKKKTTQYMKNPYKGNIHNYKRKVKEIYEERILFFDKYLIKHNFSSKEQIDLIQDILKFEYLNNLIQPRSVLVKSMGWYVQSQDGVLSVIDEEYRNKETLFDYRNYVDNVTIEDFNRPDLLENSYLFKNAFDSFIRFYFVQNDYLKYTKESFLAEKEFIQKNFDGKLENYAIARMIREYHMNGFGYSEINLVLMKELINEYKFTKPSYKEKMEEFKEELNNFNFKLTKLALDSKLINPLGDTITLEKVFKRTTQKIKVIDFWATWCPPCIREIKKVKSFKDELSEVNNVEWIYISIDKDYEKWLKKTLELQEFFNTENQYYLLGGQNSSLGKSLKIRGIPRYVIFDKQEKIILDHAPRPSDSIVFKRVIDNINLKK